MGERWSWDGEESAGFPSRAESGAVAEVVRDAEVVVLPAEAAAELALTKLIAPGIVATAHQAQAFAIAIGQFNSQSSG